MTFGRSFLPGPTDVHPEVFQATVEPLYFHRGPRMRALLAEMQPGLRRLFGTNEPVFCATTSASGLMEAAIRNGVPRRVLVVVVGFFGELFARVAEACGKEVIRANVPPGHTIEADQLEQFLEGPEVDAVALVHSESSTGALAPLAELAEVVRKRDNVHLLVDGVTSIGAMRFAMDDWGVDFAFTGSQKALALPPGLAVGAASPRFVARALGQPDRGWYTSVPNMVQTALDGLPLHTPALPLYHALAFQLRRIDAEGGLPVRWARHTAMQQLVETWVTGVPGTGLLATPGRRSPALSAITLPADVAAGDVVAAVAADGYTIAPGLDPHAHSVIRIGHMGDLTPEHLRGLLTALEPLASRHARSTS